LNIFRQIALWQAIGLLFLSNVFMTFAWYGHLKYKAKPLALVILISWLIAFFEYCLQVPANRIGSGVASASQLKVIQEVITFVVFTLFSIWYLKKDPTLNDGIAFLLIIAAVVVSLSQPFKTGPL
jgi:uncharacterized protein (DUF486 family)